MGSVSQPTLLCQVCATSLSISISSVTGITFHAPIKMVNTPTFLTSLPFLYFFIQKSTKFKFSSSASKPNCVRCDSSDGPRQSSIFPTVEMRCPGTKRTCPCV